MKILFTSTTYFILLLFVSPLLSAQDLYKYRTFSLGASLATVLKQTDQKLADVKVTHSRPRIDARVHVVAAEYFRSSVPARHR